jgi:hypothetical protein
MVTSTAGSFFAMFEPTYDGYPVASAPELEPLM